MSSPIELIEILTKHVANLEAQLEELRHITLCLCLQLQPPAGTGRSMIDDSEVAPSLLTFGSMVQSQETEIGLLSHMLMKSTCRAAGESPLPSVKDIRDALEIVRNRHRNGNATADVSTITSE